MELLGEYGLFLLQTVTLLLAALVLIGAIGRAFSRGSSSPGEGRLTITKLNRAYAQMADALRRATLPKPLWKEAAKARKAEEKADEKAAAAAGGPRRARVFVLEFEGDLRAAATDDLREEITALLTVAQDGDEVLLKLESSGGVVHGYGLAASQLERVKQRGLKLTIAVDKVAASGGYMMACVADHLVAAPFAIVGSIGVVAALPNVRRLLNRLDIDVEHMTAGEFKRTLSVVGENTDKGRAKFQEQLDETHTLFKQFIASQRPELDLGRAATGEHWYGTQALELGLVDALGTSDDLLMARAEDADLFKLKWHRSKSLGDRLSIGVTDTAARLWDRGADKARDTELGAS